MKEYKNIVMVFTLITLSGMDFGCTENPFWTDEAISAGPRHISGTVSLNDGLNSKGTVVWLDGFGIGSRADEAGRFLITLPPAASQGLMGVSGVFDLYFYIANYRVAYSKVVVRNGLFCYGSGDINKDGELYGEKRLDKLLTITTEADPAEVDTGFVGLIRVDITLQAKTDMIVPVAFPNMGETRIGNVFFRNIETDSVCIWPTSAFGMIPTSGFLVGRQPCLVRMFFHLRANVYPEGYYEIIPFLLVIQEGVPPELMASLGDGVEKLGLEYLKIPFKRERGWFQIRYGNGDHSR